MRIVQVLNSLATGGAERIALTLASAQLQSGHETSLYCIAEEGPLAEEARVNGIAVKNFRKGPGISVATLVKMVRSLIQDKPDVVHTHNPPAHYYGAVAGFLAGVPVVVNTRHSPVSSRGTEYRECYFRWLMPLTDHVIFVSQHARGVIEAEWSTKRPNISIIANGVPVQNYRCLAASPGSRYPHTVFGTLGRLVPVKGHKILVEAFGRVLERAREAQLRIIGAGPMEHMLRKQVADLGLAQRVSIEPPTNNVAAVLRQFDIFVISSFSEGLPLVVLEAMAAGLPILSTRVGGIPEVVTQEEVGWFCAPGDPEALAETMLTAHHCGDLASKGRAAAVLASQRYDVSRMASDYEQLFIDLLHARGYELPLHADCR